jgi:hypothetical protein
MQVRLHKELRADKELRDLEKKRSDALEQTMLS